MSPVGSVPPFLRRLAAHMRAGFVAAIVTTLIDSGPSLARPGGGFGIRHLLGWLIALGHLLAWQIAVFVALGAVVAALVHLSEPLPTHLGRRWGLGAARAWFRPAVQLGTDASTAAVAIAAYVLGLHAAATRILGSFHDESLARWAIALSGLGIVIALAIALPMVSLLARMLVRALEPAFRPAILVVVLFEAVVTALLHVFETRPTLLAGMDHRLLWAVVCAPLAYGIGLRFPPSPAEPWWEARPSALRPVVVSALLLFLSATSYDATSTHRLFVEDASLLGRYEIRLLHRLTDRDGDGYASRFGGGDCDDARSGVHPHAADPPGDGIDADCFAGDGSPRFDDTAVVRPIEPRPFGPVPPSILFVTIDTLRPDHVGALGYRRPTTPRIDELARTATVFSDVTAAAPRTVRSMGAVLTGLYPGQLDYRVVHLWPVLEDSNTSFAERIRGRLLTSAVLGTDYFERASGFEQGFERIYVASGHKPARGTVMQKALSELGTLVAGGRPFFLWVHFFDPHEPYLGDGTRSRFGRDLMGRYDTEISLADADFGRLLDRLRSLGAWDRTVVVVASDHGEAFGEHGTFGHSSMVYEEQVRSFVAIRVPGGTRRVVRTPVALFDLYATFLDLAGIGDAPPTPSRSLLPAVLGRAALPTERPIFTEIIPDGTYALEAYAVRRGYHKLVYYPRTNRQELYDLAADPRERVDRSDDSRALADELRTLLFSWEIATHRPENDTEAVVRQALLDHVPEDAIQRPAIRFGNEIVLEGYRIPRSATTGDVLPIDLYFRCLAPIRDDYWFHVAFEAEGGTLLPVDFEGHHQPVEGRHPTSRWRPGQLIHDRVLVRMTEHVPRNTALRASLEIWPRPRTPMAFDRGGTPGTKVDLGEFIVR